MEGPSLKLASEQLQPFKGQRILSATGNTSLGPENFAHELVKEIFAWGKHLVFQFEDRALRVHFLLFGTFETVVNGVSVTGDYKRARTPRLKLTFQNGEVSLFNCSLKLIESARARRTYDFSIDVLSRTWDPAQALKHVRERDQQQVADVLLDQEVFAGVGNIIKNEVLSLARTHPEAVIGELGTKKQRELIDLARSFSRQFLRWRRRFVLRKNLKAHGRSACPHCGGRLIKKKTGNRERWSYFCPRCQPKPGHGTSKA